MAKPKSPSAALWRINLSQCPWRSWSWLDNTHCMQKYAAVAEKNKKYCSLRTKFESSNKNNPTDWNWFKEKQKQISLFASFLLESKTVSKKCPELQIQQRGGWPSWHQFLLGRLFANWPRIIILVLEDFDCDNGDIEIDNDDTKMYLVWLLGSKSSCDQFFVGFRVTTDDGLWWQWCWTNRKQNIRCPFFFFFALSVMVEAVAVRCCRKFWWKQLIELITVCIRFDQKWLWVWDKNHIVGVPSGLLLFLNKLQNLDDTLGGQRRQPGDRRDKIGNG